MVIEMGSKEYFINIERDKLSSKILITKSDWVAMSDDPERGSHEFSRAIYNVKNDIPAPSDINISILMKDIKSIEIEALKVARNEHITKKAFKLAVIEVNNYFNELEV